MRCGRCCAHLAYTLAVVFTLALGIGATTAIFTVVHATLLRPLPYPGAERIVSIRDEKLQGISTGGLVAVPRFYDLQARNRSFEALTFFYFEDTTLVVGTHLPEHMRQRGYVGAILGGFRTYGPMLGRVYDKRDDQTTGFRFGCAELFSVAAAFRRRPKRDRPHGHCR